MINDMNWQGHRKVPAITGALNWNIPSFWKEEIAVCCSIYVANNNFSIESEKGP